ncbi:helix-turn-helix transcriptional regulator [Bradyrhizobium manausense]|uniref:helix-turn-helix transcriptional regulator n=1 Tax=Bradyrhizobium manausense TaxID=989370 RepID=UPI001BA60B3D|nr:helix-turn-helix transcriptional regulator [Bradyrhizobium manausense]MBR0686359.1 helix-turn-helix transcriptional regulator [Bradyrhizobium manausense]
MFAELDSGKDSHERLLSTFRVLVPDVRIELNGPRRAGQWSAQFAMANRLSWWQLETETEWTCWPERDEERFCLVFPASGTFGAQIRGKSLQADSSRALVLGVKDISKTWAHGTDDRHGRMSLKLKAADVRRTLTSIFQDATLENIELDPLLDLDSPAGQTLGSLVHAIAAAMKDESIRSAKAIALLREAIPRLVFKNFPHRFIDRLARHGTDASPRQIRAAVDFMRAHMHEPLTLAEIAEAVGIGERSLQHGFRTFRATTPVAYLRDLRLQQVHAELSLAENTLPVGEVALKWGFTHMGRFAAKYQAAYGQSPSETRRAARGMRSSESN